MPSWMTLAQAGLLLAWLPAAARPAPAPPPPDFEVVGEDTGPTCALYWAPGEPSGIWPHESFTLEGRLEAVSAEAALVAARGWLRAGRPSRALERLAVAPGGPERDFLRRAALAALGRWGELDGGPVAGPAGCDPLAERWLALAASARGDPVAAGRAFERLEAAIPELSGYVALWRLEAAALAGDVASGEAAWTELNRNDVPRVVRNDGRELLARLYERSGRFAMARQWQLTLASETRGRERADHLLVAARLAGSGGDTEAADALRSRVLRESPAAAAELVLDPAMRQRLGIDPLEAARTLDAAGRPELAEPFAAAALGSGTADEDREALVLRARIRAERGDRQGAEQDYDAILSRWPADRRVPEILYERARLAAKSGDGEVARRRWLDLVARHPGRARDRALRPRGPRASRVPLCGSGVHAGGASALCARSPCGGPRPIRELPWIRELPRSPLLVGAGGGSPGRNGSGRRRFPRAGGGR